MLGCLTGTRPLVSACGVWKLENHRQLTGAGRISSALNLGLWPEHFPRESLSVVKKKSALFETGVADPGISPPESPPRTGLTCCATCGICHTENTTGSGCQQISYTTPCSTGNFTASCNHWCAPPSSRTTDTPLLASFQGLRVSMACGQGGITAASPLKVR